MNPLTLLFRLPLMPLQGLIRFAEVIRDEAERELHDPARVRRELEAADRDRAAGKISDQDVSRIQEQATSSLIAGTPAGRRRNSGSPARRPADRS